MKRRSFTGIGAAGLLALAMPARAQSVGNPPRIGFLNNLNPGLASPSTDAFLRGLRDLGWVEGKNIEIEYRWADGDMARHPALAADLVKLRVALIVTAGTQAVRAAREATKTIPIVVTIMPDPVALGFAESLARPGRNVTGLANLFEELTPKQLQIFREVLPNARRVALLSDRTMGDRILVATEAAGRTLGLATNVFYVTEAGKLDATIAAARGERADGVLVLPSPFLTAIAGASPSLHSRRSCRP